MNNELIKEINGKEYHFKFKSKKCIDLEKITGKQFLEILQDTSMANIARLLKASCISPENVDEFELIDELMNGSSLEEIMFNIIYETACLSGIITRDDKNAIDNALEERKAENKKK